MPRPAAVPTALALWAVALCGVGAWLMRSHWLPHPRPDADDPAWAERAAAAGPPEWTAIHLLAADCPCSRRVFRRLAARPPADGWRERVVWVTDAAPPEDAPPGFEAEAITPAVARERYRAEAAPLLIALAPDGAPRYCGGYTARKQGPDFRDLDVLARVAAGDRPPPLPVFGCPLPD